MKRRAEVFCSPHLPIPFCYVVMQSRASLKTVYENSFSLSRSEFHIFLCLWWKIHCTNISPEREAWWLFVARTCRQARHSLTLAESFFNYLKFLCCLPWVETVFSVWGFVIGRQRSFAARNSLGKTLLATKAVLIYVDLHSLFLLFTCLSPRWKKVSVLLCGFCGVEKSIDFSPLALSTTS